jgi:hypothetical protein
VAPRRYFYITRVAAFRFEAYVFVIFAGRKRTARFPTPRRPKAPRACRTGNARGYTQALDLNLDNSPLIMHLKGCIICAQAKKGVSNLPRKNLYIPEADAWVWNEAEKLAGRTGRSVFGRSISAVVTDLLRSYVEEERRKEQGMQSIKLDLGRRGSPRWVRFEGRWLVEPDEDKTRPKDPSGEAGFYYGVALTRLGNIAVYIDNVNHSDDARLETHTSLDAAAVEGLPEDIYEWADDVMDDDYVEELDI